MSRKSQIIRILGRFNFVIYMFIAIYFMFFSTALDRTMVSDDYRYNLELFKEIKLFWSMKETYGWGTTLVNLLGNVVCFMPFGFLLPMLSKKKLFKNIVSVTIMSIAFSGFIEFTQLLTKVGAFDVDDIFLNTIGGMLGYICLRISSLRKHIWFKERTK